MTTAQHHDKPSTTPFAYRIVPTDGIWKVALPGDSVPASFHVRKEDAIASAVRLARKDGAGVLLCREDGSIETELSTAASA